MQTIRQQSRDWSRRFDRTVRHRLARIAATETLGEVARLSSEVEDGLRELNHLIARARLADVVGRGALGDG